MRWPRVARLACSRPREARSHTRRQRAIRRRRAATNGTCVILAQWDTRQRCTRSSSGRARRTVRGLLTGLARQYQPARNEYSLIAGRRCDRGVRRVRRSRQAQPCRGYAAMSSTAAPPGLPSPGLPAAQVEESRRAPGTNSRTPPKRDPWWKQYLEKFEDPVIRILVIAAIIQIGVGAYKGEYIEGLAIVIAIFLATTLAFINEFKANREFDILNRVNEEVPVKAIRDGRFLTVPRKDLVVGDIVLVETGEEVPVDGQVLEAVSLLIDESRLTGGALPVEKHNAEYLSTHSPATEHEQAYPPDRLFRGTMVADGH